MYTNKLDYIVGKCNNIYHTTIKMKSADVASGICTNFDIKCDPKFKVDDHVRISKYKKHFAKAITPNWSEEVFLIKKVMDVCNRKP